MFLIVEFPASDDPISLFRTLRHIFRPNGWLEADESRAVMKRRRDKVDKESFKILWRFRHVAEEGELTDPNDETIELNLKQAPLHVGNAIVGVDQERLRYGNMLHVSRIHTTLLVLKNLIILPLQLCVVTAVAHLSGKFDAETFRALKEVVHVVIVLALVEIAVGLKNILWGFRRKLIA